MRILVVGATGCVGRAVAHALRSRGHEVVEGARGIADTRRSLAVDYARPTPPAAWAAHLQRLDIDAVVNCAGILMPSTGQTFERVHTEGPIELFRGAVQAGVRRVVQVSALGVDGSPATLATPYLGSKLRADDALASLPLEWAVLRPSLLYGPGSQSAALFATLASLPFIGLPGRGRQRVQPLHVFELAEAIARLVEQREAPQAVFELGGAQALGYREMLAGYREALGLGPALWLPVPLPLMRAAARLAEALPQQVFCRDTIALLERGSVPADNAAPRLLGRAPSTLAHGLSVTPPEPLLDLRVRMAPVVALSVRAALAAMWAWTALVSLLLPGASGMLELLHRCGLDGRVGTAALVFSCSLNLTLGVLAWRGASPWAWALQAGAVCGYTLAAALGMPELTIDHCGPLVKNLPVLALIAAMALADPPRRADGERRRAVAGHRSRRPVPA
jgi:uncharacterized protein YbjT (DUF2867 family)